ncbi:MAG: hypothetical protein K2V38_28420 [Gemmataceae bacterium]|nr:hypothetical protein [Gemmataceae bacterium]
MRKWLADQDIEVWESFDFDMRENYYEMAWDFWANNAPADTIQYTYKEIQDHVAMYGSSEDDDEDEAGGD